MKRPPSGSIQLLGEQVHRVKEALAESRKPGTHEEPLAVGERGDDADEEDGPAHRPGRPLAGPVLGIDEVGRGHLQQRDGTGQGREDEQAEEDDAQQHPELAHFGERQRHAHEHQPRAAGGILSVAEDDREHHEAGEDRDDGVEGGDGHGLPDQAAAA